MKADVVDEKSKKEWALDEASRMRIDASQFQQMGFKVLAAWLRKNADDAMKWAARQ